MLEEGTDRERIESLAKSFPSLEKQMADREWDAIALDKWAATVSSHGEKLAAQFVLRVWNHHQDWERGKFDPIEAYGVWDDEHWRAYHQWTAAPFVL